MNTATPESKSARGSSLGTSAVADDADIYPPASGAADAVPAKEAGAIRPFSYRATQAALDDLRRRVSAVQWPEKEPVADDSQGVPLATMQKLTQYWSTEYDWRKVEARMNALPHFITEIDGLDIHFVHVRSKHKNALPLIITHGWPGSIIHQLKIVGPLVDPPAHGGKAEDAFDVVMPHLPGYGFSGKPTATGWDPARIARAWATLMARLGYSRYVAQGGDWGAIITDLMGAQALPGLIGIHTNMPGAVPSDIDKALWSGGPLPSNLTAEEKRACEQLAFAYKNVHYAFYMASRPQALYALADSPVGLAAFLLDPPLIPRSFDGEGEGLTRDDVLDNAIFYWLTNTAVSAARLYRENTFSYFCPKNVALPVAVSVFPDELYQAPRTWAERAYPNLIHYNRPAKGGHFPAWERPEFFCAELWAAFKTLRQ